MEYFIKYRESTALEDKKRWYDQSYSEYPYVIVESNVPIVLAGQFYSEDGLKEIRLRWTEGEGFLKLIKI